VSGIEVQVHPDIREIDPGVWDAVVPADELQSSHAFVTTCQEAGIEGAEYRYLVVLRGGRPIGVATLTRMQVPLDLLSTGSTRKAIAALRRRVPGALRPTLLICGLPVSAGRPCLQARTPADAPEVLRAVVRTMERLAPEMGAGWLSIKEFSPGEVAQLGPLEALGFFRAASLPSFRMRVAWNSFDEYLGALRSGYRRQMLAVLEAREREGLQIRRVSDFDAECRTIFGLYEQVIDRAPFRLERLTEGFFRGLNARLPEASSAILVEREGEVLAAAVLLRSPGLLTFFMAGIDYRVNRERWAYVNLAAEVVAEAIRTGAPLLELGQTSGALKTRLGAEAEERCFFLRARSAPLHRAVGSGARWLFPLSEVPRRRVFREGAGR